MKKKVHVEISREQASALFPDLVYPHNLPRKRKKQAKKAIIKRFMVEFEQWYKQQNVEL
jgi:hypothetical protein